MQILHCWSNAPTITYFFEGQRIPSPFLIASQLTNYPKMWFNLFPSNSSTAHLNFLLCFSFLSYDKDRVTLTTKLPFSHCQIRKLIIKQRLCLCVSLVVCGIASCCCHKELRRLHTGRAIGLFLTCNQRNNRENLWFSYQFLTKLTFNYG